MPSTSSGGGGHWFVDSAVAQCQHGIPLYLFSVFFSFFISLLSSSSFLSCMQVKAVKGWRSWVTRVHEVGEELPAGGHLKEWCTQVLGHAIEGSAGGHAPCQALGMKGISEICRACMQKGGRQEGGQLTMPNVLEVEKRTDYLVMSNMKRGCQNCGCSLEARS